MNEIDSKKPIRDHEVIVTEVPTVSEPTTERDEDQDGDFCEGGARAWLAVLGG